MGKGLLVSSVCVCVREERVCVCVVRVCACMREESVCVCMCVQCAYGEKVAQSVSTRS